MLLAAAVALAAGAGALPALAGGAGALAVAVAGILAVGLAVLRRALRLTGGAAAPGAAAAAAGDEGPRAARLVFYAGVLALAVPSVRPVGGLTVASVCFLAVLALLVLEVLRGRPPARVPGLLLAGALVFGLGGASASARAVDPLASAGETLQGVFVMAVWPWTAAMVLRTPRHLLVAVTLWTLSVAAGGAAALAQAAGLEALTGPAFGSRMTGFTDHPNDLGGAAAVALVPALLVALAGARARAGAIAAVVPALLAGAALLLSGSVAAMAAAALGVLVWLSSPVVRAPARVAVGTLAVAGIVLVAVAGGRATSPVERLRQVTGQAAEVQGAGSGAERVAIVERVLPRIAEDPLVGVGLDPAGAAVTIVSALGGTAQYEVHGLPLAAWYEAGLAGLAGVLLVGAGLALAAARSMRTAAGPAEHRLRWALVSAFVAFAVYALSAPMAFHQFGWLAAVLLVAAARLPGTRGVAAPAARNRLPVAA